MCVERASVAAMLDVRQEDVNWTFVAIALTVAPPAVTETTTVDASQ